MHRKLLTLLAVLFLILVIKFIDEVIWKLNLVYIAIGLVCVVVVYAVYYLNSSLQDDELDHVVKMIRVTTAGLETYAEIVTITRDRDGFTFIDESGNYYYKVSGFINDFGAVAQLSTNRFVKIYEMNNVHALSVLDQTDFGKLEA